MHSKLRTKFGKNSRKVFETKYSQAIWNTNFSNLVNTALSETHYTKQRDFFSDCCIVSYSTGNFLAGQERLKQSLLDNGYTGGILFFDDSEKGVPLQKDIPYGFKPYLLEKAIKKGYKNILWLDSSMICIRNPKKLFSIIKKEGTFVWSKYAEKMGYWCSDLALKSFDLTREKSFQITELCGAVFGFNVDSETGMKVFNEWNDFSKDSITFKGLPKKTDYKESYKNDTLLVSKDPNVKGHRHDQTALSFLAYKYNLKLHYLKIKDICSENVKTNEIQYSKAIGYDVIFVQNRDIKTSHYAVSYSKYGNKQGIQKMLFIILSFIDTIKRRLFYIRKKG